MIITTQGVTGDERLILLVQDCVRLGGTTVQVIHANRNHAGGVVNQFSRGVALAAMRGHVAHFAMHAIFQPLLQSLRCCIQVNRRNTRLLETEVHSP